MGGEGGGGTRKKVDKKRVAHNDGVVGPFFIFPKTIQKSYFEPRERNVAVFPKSSFSLINISLCK